MQVLHNETPEEVYAAMAECHHQAGDRFTVGAGCAVVRDTPPANLRAMRCYSREHRVA